MRTSVHRSTSLAKEPTQRLRFFVDHVSKMIVETQDFASLQFIRSFGTTTDGWIPGQARNDIKKGIRWRNRKTSSGISRYGLGRFNLVFSELRKGGTNCRNYHIIGVEIVRAKLYIVIRKKLLINIFINFRRNHGFRQG
jgi:hypothetical protein